MRRGVKISLGVVSLLFLGLAFIGCAFPLDFLIALFLGWGFYLVRVLPALTVDGVSVVTAIVVFLLFVVGLHKYCGWFYETSAESPAEGRRWKRAWSNALVWGVVLMFVAGTAMVGVSHQIVWLVTSKSPFIHSGFEAARRTHSRNLLKQIGIAAHNYHDEFHLLPAGGTIDDSGRPLHSWVTITLPYWEDTHEVDGQSLYQQIKYNIPWNDPRNSQPFQQPLSMMLNPGIMWKQYTYDEPVEFDSENRALAHYAANVLVMGPKLALSIRDITDGTSNTFMVGEVNAKFRPWGDPLNFRDVSLGINKSPLGFGSPWEGGAFFLRADGSVQFVSENVGLELLKATSTPDGGERETIPGGLID